MEVLWVTALVDYDDLSLLNLVGYFPVTKTRSQRC